MFKIAGKTDLNQISLTGIRALVLMGLLMKKPCSLEEIREEFINMQIMEQTHSDDILRIDLNTIKSMGCKISRSSPKTGYKYVLSKHPFEFKISNEELSSLKKVYNYAKSKIDLDTLIEYDDLFNKIALHICDEQTKEAILGVSLLKYYNISMIKDLICDCKYKNVLGLTYQTSGNSKEHKKQIVAQEIVYKNDKIYLYGYDLDKESPIVLNLRRIKSIISRKIQKGKIEPKLVKVKFAVKNLKENELEINEEIVGNIEAGCVVEGSYHNDFLAMQRVLSFGARCVVLEPIEFKNSIIEKIREMRKVYEC